MTTTTAPLRQEHQALLPQIEALRDLADRIDGLTTPRLVAEVDRALAFLEDGLIPHALAEDAVLYPAVALFLGGPDSTDTMSRDHLEVERLVAGLHQVRQSLPTGGGPARHEVRRLLYSLHAIVSLHFAKEEEIYLPILDDRLDPVVATGLFSRMHESAEAIRLRRAS